MNKYKGIDVSTWQKIIDWNMVKQSGVEFAMIRASYGFSSNGKDARFDYNYKNAKKAGIPVGAYHFSYATSVEDAIKEADFFYSVIKGKKFEYPVAYDVEDERIAKLGKAKVSEIVKAFCDRMEKYGYYVSVYANKYWLTNYMDDEILKKYDIWLAQWTSNPTFTKPYGIWQKSSKGKVAGIEGYVDLNESYKNYPAIMKYNGLNGFGNDNPEPPTDEYGAGKRVVFKNVPLYGTATTEQIANYLSGTFYIYDGKYIAGRYRVTNSIKNVERKPFSKFVTGFVDRKYLGG